MCSLDREIVYKFGYRDIPHEVEHYPGTINYPRAITTDSEGNIYVGDSVNYQIVKFNKQGNFVTNFPLMGDKSTSEEGDVIYSLAVDQADNIYVMNSKKKRIEVYTNNGRVLKHYQLPWAERYSKIGWDDDYKFRIVTRKGGDILVENFDGYLHFIIHASNGHIEDISTDLKKVATIDQNESKKLSIRYRARGSRYVAELVLKGEAVGVCNLSKLSEFGNNWHIDGENKLYVVTENKVSIYNLDLE